MTDNSVPLKPIDPAQVLASTRVKDLAKPNCTNAGCHGRGYTGFNRTTGKVVLCRCVQRNKTKLLNVVHDYNAQFERPSTRWQRLRAFFGRVAARIRKMEPGRSGRPADSLGI